MDWEKLEKSYVWVRLARVVSFQRWEEEMLERS
jgi:hypothetical protein